ncbi:MAG: type VI secretion system tube protein Hcp [Porticoccaceae bacterium]|jgi:type VI protein secretion system component Hcp|nr:type VI secretion system tube protein Hcp [Porticoccaceae bacterium]MEA3299017.1 type VI secretion system tube protein Hcp [Pseudomonadota bacterium]HLS99126.1 type VI secretion system tube protein Hcp [Porticoccaceae bacterium]
MNKRISLFAAIFAMLFSMSALSAAYLKFDGVEGESRDKDHKGWIDLLSVSAVVSPRDAASGLPTGKRQHKPVTVTKPIDKASPVLAKALAEGKHLTNVQVKRDGHVTVLKRARVVSIERDSAGNEVITLEPVVVDAGAASTKGKVEATWKVEEGTR